MKIWLIGFGLAACLATGGCGKPQGEEPKKEPKAAVDAARREQQREIEGMKELSRQIEAEAKKAREAIDSAKEGKKADAKTAKEEEKPVEKQK